MWITQEVRGKTQAQQGKYGSFSNLTDPTITEGNNWNVSVDVNNITDQNQIYRLKLDGEEVDRLGIPGGSSETVSVQGSGLGKHTLSLETWVGEGEVSPSPPDDRRNLLIYGVSAIVGGIAGYKILSQ